MQRIKTDFHRSLNNTEEFSPRRNLIWRVKQRWRSHLNRSFYMLLNAQWFYFTHPRSVMGTQKTRFVRISTFLFSIRNFLLNRSREMHLKFVIFEAFTYFLCNLFIFHSGNPISRSIYTLNSPLGDNKNQFGSHVLVNDYCSVFRMSFHE